MAWSRVRSGYSFTVGIAARHRPLLMAILSVLASAAVSVACSVPRFATTGWVCFFVSIFAIVLTSSLSSVYAAAPMLEYILPTIHGVLGLGTDDRITMHHLRSASRQRYEQLVDYYPRQQRSTRGRTFTFSHGIVGQCFKTIKSLNWAVPPGEEWETAVTERWSFSKDELSKLPHDRQSFFVYPIGQEGFFARAVIYMDSPDPNRFSGSSARKYVEELDRLFRDQIKEALRRT